MVECTKYDAHGPDQSAMNSGQWTCPIEAFFPLMAY